MLSGGPHVTKTSTLSLTLWQVKGKYFISYAPPFPKPLYSCGTPDFACLSMQMKMCYRALVKKPTYSENQRVPVQLCLPQMSHGLARQWTWDRTVSDADDWQPGPFHGPEDYASQRHDVSSRCHLAHDLVTTRVTSNMVTEFHIIIQRNTDSTYT